MTTTTTFNDLSLSDSPFVLDLIVQKKINWQRRLKIFDSKTKLVIPLAGKVFYGSIVDSDTGLVVGSYVFSTNNVTNEFSVSLPVATIDNLDIAKTYVHDWVYREGTSNVKVMTGTLTVQPTYTTIP